MSLDQYVSRILHRSLICHELSCESSTWENKDVSFKYDAGFSSSKTIILISWSANLNHDFPHFALWL